MSNYGNNAVDGNSAPVDNSNGNVAGGNTPAPLQLDPSLVAQMAAMLQAYQVHAPQPHLARALQWGDLPPFPGRCDRLDAWFQSLEAKLKAARVPEDRWAEKFMECPHVGDELKRRVTAGELPSYDKIRRQCLELYGPPLPIGYFRHRMFSIRGSTREEVLPPLEDALALHNRAARDHQKPEWADG